MVVASPLPSVSRCHHQKKTKSAHPITRSGQATSTRLRTRLHPARQHLLVLCIPTTTTSYHPRSSTHCSAHWHTCNSRTRSQTSTPLDARGPCSITRRTPFHVSTRSWRSTLSLPPAPLPFLSPSLSLAHAPALCFVVRFRCVRSSSPSSQEPPSRGASKCTNSANRPSHPSRRAVPALSSSCHVTHIPLRTGKDIHELTSSSASLLRYLSHPPAQLCFSYLPPTTTAPVDLTSSTSTRTPHAASDVATHLSP